MGKTEMRIGENYLSCLVFWSKVILTLIGSR